jgi:16S rRNA (guanine1516-N2)-methyltransferase
MAKRKNRATEGELICDFTTGAVAHRLRFGGGRGQDLAKAVGMKNGKNPFVIDATAGLGRDAFLLASLGARVTMIERSDKMHQLLSEAMAVARAAGGEFATIMDRMTLLHGDAKQLLPGLSGHVILVDPMHPPRRNSALVKKEMRLIREIVGIDDDAEELMEVALASARDRVVLKWPRRAEAMKKIPPPSHQFLGKSTRYDVFLFTD